MRANRLLVALLVLSSVCPAFGGDTIIPVAREAASVEADGWTFAVSPYFWAAGLSGDVASFGAPSAEIDQSFGDILSDLDFGAMMIAEARKDRFSLFGDVIYAKISSDASTPLGILASSVSVSSSSFIGTAGGGYSLIKNDQGYLDVVGAVRVWSQDTKISFDGGLLDGTQVSDGDTWVDGLVGVRGVLNFTPKLYFTGWGLVGAGGADSDWDVAGALGYHFNDRWSAVLGYRAIGVDYSNDGFLYDTVEQGPIMGAVIHF